MSKTGATDAQIEAAVMGVAGAGSNGPWVVKPMVKMVAHSLVPPTHRIVAVDDLEKLVAMVTSGKGVEGWRDVLDRIRALIGGE